MTVSNITQARDEIQAVFKTAWEADADSQNVTVLYADTAQDVPTSGHWARITVRHSDGRQATLSGEVGQRRFRKFGIVTVQVFTESGDGLVTSDTLTAVAESAFQGVTTNPGRVLFRNVRTVEVGQEGNWHQSNVLASFEYDEVR